MKVWYTFRKNDPNLMCLRNYDVSSYEVLNWPNSKYDLFCEERDPYLQPVYQWQAGQFNQKVHRKNKNDIFPLHLYHTIEGSTIPLENKLFGVRSSGTYIIIEFNIPDDEVLLYDDNLFIICLNREYLALTQEEDKSWEPYLFGLSQLGISTWQILDKEYYNNLLPYQQHLADSYLKFLYRSWKNIFNIYLLPNDWVVSKNKTLMALTWQIKKEYINNFYQVTVNDQELIDYSN